MLQLSCSSLRVPLTRTVAGGRQARPAQQRPFATHGRAPIIARRVPHHPRAKQLLHRRRCITTAASGGDEAGGGGGDEEDRGLSQVCRDLSRSFYELGVRYDDALRNFATYAKEAYAGGASLSAAELQLGIDPSTGLPMLDQALSQRGGLREDEVELRRGWLGICYLTYGEVGVAREQTGPEPPTPGGGADAERLGPFVANVVSLARGGADAQRVKLEEVLASTGDEPKSDMEAAVFSQGIRVVFAALDACGGQATPADAAAGETGGGGGGGAPNPEPEAPPSADWAPGFGSGPSSEKPKAAEEAEAKGGKGAEPPSEADWAPGFGDDSAEGKGGEEGKAGGGEGGGDDWAPDFGEGEAGTKEQQAPPPPPSSSGGDPAEREAEM